MAAFSLSPLAEGDLEEIWFYFARYDPENADRFLGELLTVLQMLADNPLGAKRTCGYAAAAASVRCYQ